MKRKISFTLVICLIFTLTVSYSFAISNDSSESGILEKEQELIEEIINSDKNTIYDGDYKVEKLSNEYVESGNVGVEGFDDSEIDQMNFYKLENENEQSSEESSCVIVADIHLADEEDASSNNASSGSRASHNYDVTDEAGRVTIYLKVSYTSRTFDGAEYRKLTKIQGKAVDYPTTLTMRRFTLKYSAKGGYYTSSGTRGANTTAKTDSAYWTSNFKTLRTLDTSSIDRFYNAEGLAILQARATIKYGPSTNIVDRYLYYNVCET